MTFRELAERACDRDRGLLATQIKARRAEGFEVFSEGAFCDSAGKVVCAPDGLMLPLRTDIALRRGEEEMRTENAESRTIAFREPVFASWDHMKVEIRSISWASLVLKCAPAKECDWSGVCAWFYRWFDQNDSKRPDELGLYGVVHFISDPNFVDGWIKFHVDLGTSSTRSISDLLDELSKLGFEHCIIGEQSFPDNFIVD